MKTISPMLKVIYETYLIDYNSMEKSKSIKDRIRIQARRCLEKSFAGKTWETLTVNEQDYFVLHCMKEYMMTEISENIFRSNRKKIKEIETHIELLIKKRFVAVNERIEQYNDLTNDLYQKDKNGYSKYGELQSDLIDIYNSCENNSHIYPTIDIISTQIDVLSKIIQEKLGVIIHTDKIEECCKFMANMELPDGELIDLEADPNSKIPVEEQDTLIENYRKYFEYKIQKEDLDFYTDYEFK